MDETVWYPFQDVMLEMEAQGIFPVDVTEDELVNFDWETKDESGS